MFEVVDFSWPYHVIQRRPCHVKFMAIPSYAYIKLKIPGPARVIIVEAKTQRALNYLQDIIELAAAVVTTAKLRELSSAMPLMLGGFKTDKDAKVVQIDAGNPDKTVQTRASLNPK
jgi:hypothetical protein